MAAHSFLHVGQQWLFACREDYMPELASMFSDDELETNLEFPRYSIEAWKLRERLDVLGFTASRARARIEKVYLEAKKFEEHLEPMDEWLKEVGRLVDDPVNVDDVPDWTAWVVDSRLIVRLILDRVPPSIMIKLDIGEVVSRGYVTAQRDFCASAFESLHGTAAIFAPLIVLTEGVTDAELLSMAIDLLAPHLSGYIRFLDYEFRPEGSASALVRAVRAFAAAGVSNRVVALFDNDSAASEALLGLNIENFPSNFRIIQLPHVELAEDYPTIGPSGLVKMDVNGLAASVEMFFGVDVLRLDESSLSPVQWRGYMGKVKQYQGELMAKAELQSRFRMRAQSALRRGGVTPEEDWSGMKLIIQTIANVFTE